MSRFLQALVAVLTFLPGIWTTAVAQSQNATLRIIVLSVEEGTPVAGATVLVSIPRGDTLYAAATNANGYAEFQGLPPRSYELHVRFIGYENLIREFSVQRGEIRVLNLEIRQSAAKLNELVIGADRSPIQRDAGLQIITSTDIARVPSIGPGGDLTTYLQNLPGVVTTGDRGGELYIRGGTPIQNMVLVDKMPVIKPFHISNLFSAFPQEVISQVDMYAGGFGPEYTGVTSSILDVSLRQGNMRSHEVKAAVSPYVATLQVEGPVVRDRQSFLFMGRYSLIDRFGPILTGEEVPMEFYDITARYSVNWQDFVCNLTGIYTSDRGKINPFLKTELYWANGAAGFRCLGYSPELRNTVDFTMGTSMFESTETGVDETGRRVGIAKTFMKVDNGGMLLDNPFNYGVRVEFTKFTADLDAPFADRTGTGRRFIDLDSELEEFTSIFTGYMSWKVQPNLYWTFQPGLASQMSLKNTSPTFEPRFRMSYRPFGNNWQEVSFATGRYVQMMEGITDERDAGTVFYVYKPIGSRDPYPISYHAIVGYKHQFNPSLVVNLEAYAKRHYDIPVAVWTREPANTIRTGRVDSETMGMDIQVVADYGPYYLSVGYGLSEVEYVADARQLVAWVPERIFRYNPAHDRRHQLNILSSVKLSNYVVSLSWQYSSGAPYTKIAAYDLTLPGMPDQNPIVNRGRVLTLYTRPYDGRLPSFHRLDASVGRNFRLSRQLGLETKAGVINAYNVRNVFYYDVNTMQQVDQVRLLPYISILTHFK